MLSAVEVGLALEGFLGALGYDAGRDGVVGLSVAGNDRSVTVRFRNRVGGPAVSEVQLAFEYPGVGGSV